MKKVCVIGLGDISSIHINALKKLGNIRISAMCDIDGTLKRKYPDYKFYSDYREMLEKENPDCVHICLPHYLHYKVAKEAIEKEINVFLEKPVGIDVFQTNKLLEIEEKNPHIKICVCLQNRLNRTFEKMMEFIKSGSYGKVKGIKGIVTWNRTDEYYNLKPWRKKMEYSGGGVMINQTIHTLDLMQLIGGKIKNIKGVTVNLEDHDSEFEIEDTALAKIKFENGIEGIYFATVTYSENSSVELQVITEKAKFTIKDSILTISEKNGYKKILAEDDKLEGTKFYYGASHEKLIQKFYKCLETGSDDYIHVKDAVPSMKMIEMIKKSSGKIIK
ncbi:gfo/Idh/MocA family oxidoreductase [Leptotrichia sp. OH3620_COT-345]|uniref:Gfo/Idh/MocA family protein n=1 Tax=Leptotrichia sp. OH3620_COT-345 TaxID=2491048 RepID=UPI000F64B249|nr:Gfo/Idh/MocA family oxidoreductase [Leptotrichia sp. OH3620_COT-345]RRD40173.1 gfo/Idh/MocA family oxidoreductase [Leptotrichia sp. OH3620_COT-345]